MKTIALVALAMAIIGSGTVAGVTLPQVAMDHWNDHVADNFPNPETPTQGADVTGHPNATVNGVPSGPPVWLNPDAPHGPPTWLSADTPRGPPSWVNR